MATAAPARARAPQRYLVRIDPDIYTDVEFAERASIDARFAYFDSLFFLAGLGEPDGLYPHAELDTQMGGATAANAVADQLTSLGVWTFNGLGYSVHPHSGCRIVPERRAPIPDALRAAIYARDGYRCLDCGATSGLSLDHIYPWSLGGQDTADNLRTLCRPCNSSKGARI